MDKRNWLGAIAETKAAAEYLRHEWEIYSQTSGKGPFDLVAYKDGQLRRIQVKATGSRNGTSSKAYIARLRSVRYNRTSVSMKKLDPLSYDELVIYVEPLDKLFFFTPNEVRNRDTICIHPDKLDEYRSEPRLLA